VIRPADIFPELRRKFEGYGEAIMLAAIQNPDPTRLGAELEQLGRNQRTEIILWLRERDDVRERRERTMRWIAWVTVVVVVLSFILAVLSFLFDLFGSRAHP